MKKLVVLGVQPNFKETTLFALACGNDAKAVKLMLQCGASPSEHVYPGLEYTRPLMLASANGRLDVVKVLVEHGANVNDTATYDNWNKWALLDACEYGHFGVANYLIHCGSKVSLLTFCISPLLIIIL
jgi:ankyrin repeat protein